MNIIGVGIDIVSLARIQNAPNKDRFAEYIMTEDELDTYFAHKDKVQFLSSRLAAKEAVIKASPKSLTYHDFSITKVGRKPTVSFIREDGVSLSILLSISHEFDNTVACALAYKS